jgi:hypothetical protein
MHTIESKELTVELLDPEKDQSRMGARYCTAGYIFQIHHKTHGPLLSGPTYPESFNWFDGQGIPDSFHRAPLSDPQNPNELVIPGVGRCTTDAKKVLEFTRWERSTTSSGIQWTTQQKTSNHTIRISRTVFVEGRTVRSVTRFENLQTSIVPVSWYPHPFYPQPADDELCRFTIPISFRDTDYFSLGADQSIHRVGWPWTGGAILAIEHDARDHVGIFQRHVKMGSVGAIFGYVPSYMMVYGNPNCFSVEPYFERALGPAQSAEWYVDYVF